MTTDVATDNTATASIQDASIQDGLVKDAVVPADTWTVVGSTGSGDNVSYFMQVPVWLEDLA